MGNATGAAAALRPVKAGEALVFRLAVELGHPLVCQLSGQVIRQHHGLLSLVQLAWSCARR
jgi:hypothetical protein